MAYWRLYYHLIWVAPQRLPLITSALARTIELRQEIDCV